MTWVRTLLAATGLAGCTPTASGDDETGSTSSAEVTTGSTSSGAVGGSSSSSSDDGGSSSGRADTSSGGSSGEGTSTGESGSTSGGSSSSSDDGGSSTTASGPNQACVDGCVTEFECGKRWRSEEACVEACEANLIQAEEEAGPACRISWQALHACLATLTCEEFVVWQMPVEIPYPCISEDEALAFECADQ